MVDVPDEVGFASHTQGSVAIAADTHKAIADDFDDNTQLLYEILLELRQMRQDLAKWHAEALMKNPQ